MRGLLLKRNERRKMKIRHILLIILLAPFGCGEDIGTPTMIGGIDASEGCGVFDQNSSMAFSISRNNCPFRLNSPFTLIQNGCSAGLISATTDGNPVIGVIDYKGNYGFEITAYECSAYIPEMSIILPSGGTG